jgi:hypothetical protein
MTVKCPRCGADLLLCLAGELAPREPVVWASDTPIKDLPFLARGKHALENDSSEWRDGKYFKTDRWKTAGDLDAASDFELLRIPEFGKVALRQVREAVRLLKEKGT